MAMNKISARQIIMTQQSFKKSYEMTYAIMRNLEKYLR